MSLLPIRMIEAANPDWRLLAWILAGVTVAFTFLAVRRAVACTGGELCGAGIDPRRRVGGGGDRRLDRRRRFPARQRH